MKIIKPKDFPIKMTAENINILAKMKLMFPQSLCYRDVIPFLSFEDKILISNRVRDIKNIKEREHWNALTPEEQAEEKRKIEESMKDTTTFRGNLLEQERHAADMEKRRSKNKNDKNKE